MQDTTQEIALRTVRRCIETLESQRTYNIVYDIGITVMASIAAVCGYALYYIN
jgi:hypothetical protein